MALVTLIDNTGYLVAWPGGCPPFTKEDTIKILLEANHYFTGIGLDPPYVEVVVCKCDRSPNEYGWDGKVKIDHD